MVPLKPDYLKEALFCLLMEMASPGGYAVSVSPLGFVRWMFVQEPNMPISQEVSVGHTKIMGD